ncbi:T9SS type A sorting domain-containing protein [Bacteroidales bacterium OttesenSCG-928-K03]|nr:T9SS type A sorting domain-containing protein [Bacteroidales bacterium OttesenSCG-928-K22]MDL2242619.1 T9SS type A sorting domain-containing protein [Bacteroidales bacterium OttesenSCG-928-K03]
MEKKKILILSILLIGISVANAQNGATKYEYCPLVEEGKNWSILDAQETYNPSPIQDFTYRTHRMIFYGDTIINDLHYKKMYSSTEENSVFPHGWTLQGFMREDEKRVWYKQNYLNSTEKLYYDFSLEIGDLVPNALDTGENIIIEDITYEIMNNGEERKVFWLSSNVYSPFDIDKEFWIEGVGSNVGLIYPLHGILVGGFYRLLCHHENEESIFEDDVLGTCYKSSIGIETYNNIIDIYPNPAKDMITINYKGDSDIDCISIINTKGQIIQKYKYGNYIDVSNVPKGMYFVKISINNREDIIRKIIILK